jgi:predicted O-linked N-acetylglucosamine transferase (SPINDLY family)
VDTNAVKYLCAQSLFKLLPQYDDAYPRIAMENRRARFLFIGGHSSFITEAFLHRLGRAFARCGLDATDYCLVLPRLPHAQFLGLCRAADVILDSPIWSGFNSTMEAIAFDKPVVTLPGPMMRGRHTYGVLRRLGIEDTVARDLDDYVDIAARIGADAPLRSAVVEQTRMREARLYDDREAIRSLERFLLHAVG